MNKSCLKSTLDNMQSVAIILGVCVALWQLQIQNETLQATKEIESGKFMLELSKNMDADKYASLIDAIEGHDANFHILKNQGGKFSDNDVEDYIGNFETIGYLETRKLIDLKMAYNEFSYDVEKAWCNQDVKNHIVEVRKQDSTFFANFESLALAFLKEDKRENCKNLPS